MSTGLLIPFERGQSTGVGAVVAISVISTLALSAVLLHMVWVIIISLFNNGAGRKPSRSGFFFKTHLGQFAACLLGSYLLSSISGILSARWLMDGGVTQGTLCIAQAVLTGMGGFGSAYFIVAMGVHTFNTLVLRHRQPNWLIAAFLMLGLIGMIAIGVGPSSASNIKSGPVYSSAGAMCAITEYYPILRLILRLLPMFTAALLSTVIYSLIFLILRGTLVINGGLRLNLDAPSRWTTHDSVEGYQRFLNSIARSMLWFPVAFVLFLVPSSIIQLMDISDVHVSFGVLSFAYILELLLGVVNVIILYNVLRVLGPAIGTSSSPPPRSDVESFGSPDNRLSPVEKPALRPLFLGGAQHFPPPKKSLESLRRVPVKYDRTSIISSSSLPLTHDRPWATSHSRSSSSARLLAPPSRLGHAHTLSAASSISVVSAASLQRAISPHITLDEDVLTPLPPALIQQNPVVVPQLHITTTPQTRGLTAAPRKGKSPSHSRSSSTVSNIAADMTPPGGSPRRATNTVHRYAPNIDSPRSSSPSLNPSAPAEGLSMPSPSVLPVLSIPILMKGSPGEQDTPNESPAVSSQRSLSLISMYYSRSLDVPDEMVPSIPTRSDGSFSIPSPIRSNRSSDLPVVDAPSRPYLQASVSMTAVGVPPTKTYPVSPLVHLPRTPLTPDTLHETATPSRYAAYQTDSASDLDAAAGPTPQISPRPSLLEMASSRFDRDPDRTQNASSSLSVVSELPSQLRLSTILDVSPVSTQSGSSLNTSELSNLDPTSEITLALARQPTVSRTLRSELRARTATMIPESIGGLSSIGFATLVAGAASSNGARVMSESTERRPSKRLARESSVDSRAGPIPPVLRPGTPSSIGSMSRKSSVSSIDFPTPPSVPGLHARKPSASASAARAGAIAAADPYATMRQVQAARPQFGRAVMPSGPRLASRVRTESSSSLGSSMESARSYGFI